MELLSGCLDIGFSLNFSSVIKKIIKMQNLLYPFTYITKSYMAIIYPQKDGNNLLGKFSKMQRNILLIFITINNMF